MSSRSHAIAMQACMHGGQAAFMRNFLGYSGFAIGTATGVVTFGGIIVGSSGLMAAGSVLGMGASTMNLSGNLMDGNYGAALLQVPLASASTAAYSAISNARNMRSIDKAALNFMIFKSDNIGQLGINIAINQNRN